MVIELLKFRVASDRPKKFIQKDAEIWMLALATYSGFFGKEVWSDSKEPTVGNYDNSMGETRTVEVYSA